jgi:hypothetical protein
MTTREVVAALGVPQQRVTQIERNALAKLRRSLDARGFALEDLVWGEPDCRSPEKWSPGGPAN